MIILISKWSVPRGDADTYSKVEFPFRREIQVDRPYYLLFLLVQGIEACT